MLGNHSLWLLQSQWSFLCSVSYFWTCNVPSHIQMACSYRCVSLGQYVLHKRHQTMCIIGLFCLPQWPSYHQLFALGIATLASISPYTPWWYWSLWCIETVWLGQCWTLPLLIPIVFLQILSVLYSPVSFLHLWNSHQCSANPYLTVMIPSLLVLIWTNKLIPWCYTSWIEVNLCPLPGTYVASLLIMWC